MEAFSSNVRYFEQFGGFKKTFLEKWRLLVLSVRHLKKLRGFLKTFSEKIRLFLINVRDFQTFRGFLNSKCPFSGIEAFLK
jgi:hypothetical protein